MSHHRPVGLALSILALALAGCGGDDGSPNAPATSDAPPAATGAPPATENATESSGDPETDAAVLKTQQALKQVYDKRSADVPRAVVRSWPAKFCSLKVGMPRSEVRTVMGEPTETETFSRGPEDSWYGPDVAVTASFQDGEVFRLEDVTGMSKLPCEAYRDRNG